MIINGKEYIIEPGADLREADLRGANLAGAYLVEVDLRGADLTGANLMEAYLRGADLREADLRGTDLKGAKLDHKHYRFSAGQHEANAYNGYIRIGCKYLTAKEWLEEYKEIGAKEGYTPKEIREYGSFIKMYAKECITK